MFPNDIVKINVLVKWQTFLKIIIMEARSLPKSTSVCGRQYTWRKYMYNLTVVVLFKVVMLVKRRMCDYHCLQASQ